MAEPLLEVDHLSVDYTVGAGTFHALRDVSFAVAPGRVVGIVGETGCGKSTLAHAIPRLLPEPPARVVAGAISFRGVDLLALPRWRMPSVRGTGIAMVFQEPINSLNPAFRVLDQVREAVRVRRLREAGVGAVFRYGDEGYDYARGPPRPGAGAMLARPILPGAGEGPVAGGRAPVDVSSGALRAEVLEMLRLVRINDPERILSLYPHELSGGMRQRVMIAIALSGRPSLLIADEPTSALDVTIQAQVLTLMKDLLSELRTSILFISHDLGVIAEMVDEVGVMYAGELVEFGPIDEVFDAPHHPYTRALLRAVPNRYKDDGPLAALGGSVPNLSRLPPGCAFAPRCSFAQDVCRADPGPPLRRPRGAPDSSTHRAACHFAEEVGSA
ncbi:MAG TPA: ABC transporter ATP-binding protein [Thermoplasmata archaeon]|nr:ABC transporter ATP-binding protein [Thermoplasmata archaeon]